MARQMKSGQFWSGKLSDEAYHALSVYVEHTGLSKTRVVEQAIIEYVQKNMQEKESNTHD